MRHHANLYPLIRALHANGARPLAQRTTPSLRHYYFPSRTQQCMYTRYLILGRILCSSLRPTTPRQPAARTREVLDKPNSDLVIGARVELALQGIRSEVAWASRVGNESRVFINTGTALARDKNVRSRRNQHNKMYTPGIMQIWQY